MSDGAIVGAVETEPATASRPVDDAVAADDNAAASAEADQSPGDAPRRKRGRPKGSTNKAKPRRVATEAQKAAARANGAKGRFAPPDPRPSVTDEAIREGMAQLYGLLAMAVAPFDPTLAPAIAACTEPNPYGPGAPDAWVALSKQYPAVRAAIASMGGSTAIAAMFTAHLPLLMVVQARVAARGPAFGRRVEPDPEPAANGAGPIFTGAPIA